MASAASLSAAALRLLGPSALSGAHFIDGAFTAPLSARVFPSISPATGAVFAQVAAGDARDIDLAVAAARRAVGFGGVSSSSSSSSSASSSSSSSSASSAASAAARRAAWSGADGASRGRLLWALAASVRAHAEPLAELETWDSGKPLAEARADVSGTAEILEYYAGLSSKLAGQAMSVPGAQMAVVLREPVGVVGLITPWNYPLYVAAWKFAPALCAGNAVVLKPSELTSLTALVAAKLAHDVGFPPGIFNVVCGRGNEAGAALAAHPDVDVLGFTGGPASGGKVLTERARLLKPTQLELGGKSPNVVFEDADLPRAVAGAAYGIFFNQGENCNAGSRVLVHESIYDAFVAQLAETARRIRVLPPLDERSQMGALISNEHRTKVHTMVEAGQREGARLVTGGHPLSGPGYDGGFFYSPTVLADVARENVVFREEIFGPVVTVTPFRTDDEAISLANATEYGLAAGVWTASVPRALRCVQEIQAGYVWVNTYNNTPVEVPFGGQKGSGFGRDCGIQAIDTYTTWKSAMWATAPFQPWY